MLIPKLALKNMRGAGLKTWLNAGVLSMAFVVIIWTQGLYQGIDAEASRAMTDTEYGGGQFWMNDYDPYDPLTLQDAHAPVPAALGAMIDAGKAAPFLVVPATIYPNGRLMTALLKGVDPDQRLLSLPAASLKASHTELPALIGSRMAQSAGLKKGDVVTVRWRDARGTFDAREIEIVEVMSTVVATIDNGLIWLPLETLREMAALPGQATIVVMPRGFSPPASVPGWSFKGLDDLLKDLKSLVQTKTIGASILYAILILLAMLAVFNTQLLSIWRRRKEIGTIMALGMPRGRVIELFTLEGALTGVLAAAIGAVYGVPLLAFTAIRGIGLGASLGDSFGLALSEKLYPVYSALLVGGTTFLVFLVTTAVSYLPTRRISRLKPTDALRGRFS
jgi:ABC-type lipoprotein release transport system permease subunit